MKRLVFLLILVSVTASLSGCRRGLFGMRNCGGQAPPTYQAPAAPVCPCPPAACVCPPATCPVTVPVMMPACSCQASTVPVMSGASYATGSTLAPVVEGQFMSPPAIDSVPMQGAGTVYGGALPTNGTTGLQVVKDRVLQPGEMIAPADSLKVGQK